MNCQTRRSATVQSHIKPPQYFVVGGNPSGHGGGVLASTPSRWEADWVLAPKFVREGYRKVQVLHEDVLYGSVL